MIEWTFISQHASHFGGLWEAAVKSMKKHLKVTGEVKLTYEELSTVMAQIEACLNRRPLILLPSDKEGIEVFSYSWTLSSWLDFGSTPR